MYHWVKFNSMSFYVNIVLGEYDVTSASAGNLYAAVDNPFDPKEAFCDAFLCQSASMLGAGMNNIIDKIPMKITWNILEEPKARPNFDEFDKSVIKNVYFGKKKLFL